MARTEHQIDVEFDSRRQPFRLMSYGFFACAVLVSVAGLALTAYEIVWEVSSERAFGRVVEFESDNRQRMNAIYEFAVGDRTYRGKIFPPKGSKRPKVQIGDPVTVLYQPKRPSSFVRDTVESRFGPSFFFGTMMIPFWLGFAACAKALRDLEKARQAQKSAH